MKWKYKGKEENKNATEFLLRWGKHPIIYVFGAGKIGHRVAATLGRFGLFGAFVDNDVVKQQSKTGESSIISFDEYLERKDGCIVVGVGVKYKNEIITQLKNAGLTQNKDFYEYDYFENIIMADILYYIYDTVYVMLAQISLTERCTLHCRKCAHGCYAVPNHKEDLSIEKVFESADLFFSVVDYIEEFVLIGGEPFLYKDIDKAIAYIGSRYREKMGIFSVTTNGTLIPSEDVLSLCRKYDMTIRISNYEDAIPQMKEQYKKLQARLEEFGITNFLGSRDHHWMDYGFDYVDRKADEDTLIKVFDECATPCREVRGHKYYFCVMARTVSENLGFDVGKDDFLDLREAKENRRIFVEFDRGYSEKGYLDMCNYCNGADSAKHLIPVAEQLCANKDIDL